MASATRPIYLKGVKGSATDTRRYILENVGNPFAKTTRVTAS
jgi:hypothetical protein